MRFIISSRPEITVSTVTPLALLYTLRALILSDPVLPYKQYYTTVLNCCQVNLACLNILMRLYPLLIQF